MKRILRGTTLTAALALLAACGGAEKEPEVVADAEMVAEPAGGMEGMPGMGGMESVGQGGIAAQLQAHMQMMEGASGEELQRMLPEHRQLVANMVAQFNREMRDMNMADDSDWNQTVDALRNDLVRLPEMSADELQAFLPEHQARIDRLIDMHRGMMGDMQM
jgi:predicted small lipoprotein YifL